jgi:hypothetical protein
VRRLPGAGGFKPGLSLTGMVSPAGKAVGHERKVSGVGVWVVGAGGEPEINKVVLAA